MTWTSSNPAVIKVMPPFHGGHGADWTALSAGTTVITATCEGISHSETVTVGADGLPALEVMLNRSLYDALPGTTMEELVNNDVDYTKLDVEGSAVRIRLGASVVKGLVAD